MTIGLQDSPATFVPDHLRAGITLLKTARQYAIDLKTDVWDFAVEFETLRAAGLDKNDLRWLLRRSYVHSGEEMTQSGSGARQFRIDQPTEFTQQTCFVLTQLGTDLSDNVFLSCRDDDASYRQLCDPGGRSFTPSDPATRCPTWDSDRHELRVGHHLVKQYKLNSPNQESILAAFQEEGWPPRIHDPLAPRPEAEPKERLRNTIKSLNRKQVNRLIRFMGDGTGEAVRWELTSESRELLPSLPVYRA